MKLHKRNFFGVLGVLFYYTLSFPVIRSILFGEKGKILDAFSGEVMSSGDMVKQVGQTVLLIPFFLNKYFFSYFDINNVNVLVLGLMTPIVYRYFCYSKSIHSFLLLLFLFFPAPLLFLSTFTKDTLLVLFLFFSYGYYRNLELRGNPMYFLIYIVSMRPYLIWVPMVLKSKDMVKGLIIVAVMFVLLLQFDITNEIIYRIFNRRLVDTLYDANSQIYQSIIVREPFHIVQMIYEVFPQVFFPIFFGVGLKSIAFQLYIFIIILVSIARRNPYSNTIIALMFMYAVLDPDLGAYLRHVSSFFIFFPMILGLDKFARRQNA